MTEDLRVGDLLVALLGAYETWKRASEKAQRDLVEDVPDDPAVLALMAGGAFDVKVRLGANGQVLELSLQEYLEDLKAHRYLAVLERLQKTLDAFLEGKG